MPRFGDVFENRVTGEYAVVIRGDEDGGGESGLGHLVVKPGGAAVGEHVHPHFQERFQVVSGSPTTACSGGCAAIAGPTPSYLRPQARVVPDPAVAALAGVTPPSDP